MASRKFDPALKNRIARVIVRVYRRRPNDECSGILLAIFLPALSCIHHRKSHWDSSADELWQNIIATFFEVVRDIDVDLFRKNLIQRIYGTICQRGIRRRRNRKGIPGRDPEPRYRPCKPNIQHGRQG